MKPGNRCHRAQASQHRSKGICAGHGPASGHESRWHTAGIRAACPMRARWGGRHGARARSARRCTPALPRDAPPGRPRGRRPPPSASSCAICRPPRSTAGTPDTRRWAAHAGRRGRAASRAGERGGAPRGAGAWGARVEPLAAHLHDRVGPGRERIERKICLVALEHRRRHALRGTAFGRATGWPGVGTHSAALTQAQGLRCSFALDDRYFPRTVCGPPTVHELTEPVPRYKLRYCCPKKQHAKV